MRADKVLDLLNDRTRREVLRQLISSDETAISLDDLVSSSELSASKIDLYHNQLPKLAAGGVVDWNPDDEMVSYRPAEPVEDLLDTLSRHFDEPGPPVEYGSKEGN